MPTFLDNSLAGLNRGWQQLYGGQQAAGPASTNLYGRPAATPVVAAPPAVIPVAANPAVGQPLSGEGSTDVARGPNEDQMLGAYYAHLLGLPFIRRMAADQSQSGAMPISYNPETGQPLSGNDGSGDGSGAGLLSNNGTSNAGFFSWLQNLFSRAGGSPQQTNQPVLPQGSTIAQPGSSYEAGLENLGPAGQWPTGSTVVPGQYVMGPSEGDQPGQILATGSDASANPSGGGSAFGIPGGMTAGQMGGSAIGAIGSGISDIGKGISNTKSTYTAPNIPLPQRAVFTPPTLAPNRNF